MFRIIKADYLGDKSYIEAACLSTDAKETDGIATGSLALEVDTGSIYAYDEDGGSWSAIVEG